MRRRVGLRTWATGLAAPLLAGCLRVATGEAVGPVAPDRPAPPPSDYQVVPTPPPATVSDAGSPPPVERVGFAAGATAPEPASPPLAKPFAPEAAAVPPHAAPPPTAPADPPLVEALRCVLDKRPGAALELLQRYDKEDQELLLGLLQLAAPLAESGPGRRGPEQHAALLDQLNALTAAERARAPLVVDKLCFCRYVGGFGDYDPLPDYHAFRKGADGRPGEQVLVYLEVRNFVNRTFGDGTFQTALGVSVEARDARGHSCWVAPAILPKVGRGRTPRQDYLLRLEFHVPPELRLGSAYTLWVQVKDLNNPSPRGVVRRSLDFRVAGEGE